LRACLHFAVAVNLLIAFSQSPFGHVHSDGLGHAQHLHWHLEDPDHPMIEAEEENEEALWVDWLAGDGTSFAKTLIVLPVSAYSFAWMRYGLVRPAPALRSHDPPWRAGLPARAPPQV
jgi:hypothetical protein